MLDLALSDDERNLQELFSSFFAKESPISVVRESEPLGFDRELWNRLVTTGAHEMAVDGASKTDMVVVAEQIGRHIAPVPLIEHLVASKVCSAAGIEISDAIATLALRPAVDGNWGLVPAGAVADVVVGVDGGELVCVSAPPTLTAPKNHAASPIADRSTSGARTVVGDASDFVELLSLWQTLTSAALVGIATRALELALEYVNTRVQFDVKIGSFQSVQHGLADLPGLIDGARFLTFKSAWAHGTTVDVDDHQIDDPIVLASMAFLFASEVASVATDRSLHYHGGYGFSSEYDIQLYFRRARGWALILGSTRAEELRLADLMFGAK